MSTTHEQDTTATNGQDTAMSDAPISTVNPLTRLALGIIHDQLDKTDPTYVGKSDALKRMCSRFGIDISQCALKTRSTQGGGSGSDAEDDDDEDDGDHEEELDTLMQDYRKHDDPEETEGPHTEADKADREVRRAAERYINKQLLRGSNGTETEKDDNHDDEFLGAVLSAYNCMSGHTAAQGNTISDSQELASNMTTQAQAMMGQIQAMESRLNEQDGLITYGRSFIQGQTEQNTELQSQIDTLRSALAPFLVPLTMNVAAQVLRTRSWPEQS